MSPQLRFEVFTLFPEVFEPYLQSSILLRAQQRGLVEVHLHNIRDWATGKHHITDDEPYGGGGGMVMKPEPIFAAVESIMGAPPACPVILLTPQGRLFTQAVAQELVSNVLAIGAVGAQGLRPDHEEAVGAQGLRPSQPDHTPEQGASDANFVRTAPLQDVPQQDVSLPGDTDQQGPAPLRLALLCGRYEGVDERVRQQLVTDEISIGDYVLTGGELPAMVVIDAITRLIPGVLGDPDGAWDDSHASGLLEYPHYTRPPEFRGQRVPEVLVSGDHARIARWRREQALLRTWQRRPDLLRTAPLTEADRKYLSGLEKEEPSQP
jgi:tRNA (guanine37-N1)-methyltransferase